MDLPSRALSVRQPWAWAIVHAGKDVENRSKGFFGHQRHSAFNGAVAIHAAKGMTQDEYRDAAEFMAARGVVCPPPADLVRGGIIGTVQCVAVVSKSHSPWFMGPFGLVLEQQRPVEPIPCPGQLGYFEWRGPVGEFDKPLRWMERWGQTATEYVPGPLL